MNVVIGICQSYGLFTYLQARFGNGKVFSSNTQNGKAYIFFSFEYRSFSSSPVSRIDEGFLNGVESIDSL